MTLDGLTEKQKTYISVCHLIMSLHSMGSGVRTIARMFGMSKSTLHRRLPEIEALAKAYPDPSESSHLGQ